jgi:HEAT repeat protein
VKRIGQTVRPGIVSRALPVLVLLACQAFAQPPKIGEINFYGLRKLPAATILTALGIKPGDPLPKSKGDLEDRLGEVPGVVDGRIEALCCDGSNTTLFIGVEERGGPHFDTHGTPAGAAALPDEIINQYHELLTAVARAARNGTAGEDLSAGHSLMADPDARRLQEGFAAYASENLQLLRDVLRDGSEPEQRATAAVVMGYAPKKSAVLNDLQYALQDPDDSVRGNAARSLKAIAVMALKQQQASLKVAPVWFVEMLNSIALSDRIQAAQTLVILTDQPNPAAVDLLRERALPALAEMARWKTLDYALPAFLLLGRVAAMNEADIQNQWRTGDREAVIRKATEPAPRTKR